MLAEKDHTDLLIIMFHHAAQMQRDHSEKFFLSLFFSLAAGKDPWIADGRAADHDGVAAGPGHHGIRIRQALHVPVTDHRDGENAFDLSDGIPIGLAGIFLFACTRVYGNGAGAALLGDACDLQVIQLLFVPAEPELGSYRNVQGFHEAFDHFNDLLRMFE